MSSPSLTNILIGASPIYGANLIKSNGGSYDIAKRKKIKISPVHVETFNYYRSIHFLIDDFNVPKYESNGYSALECFVYFDTHGKWLPCNQPLQLHRVLCGKSQVNLQIKIWVDSIIDFPFTIFEFREDFKTMNHPKWVLDSVEGQLKKYFMKRDGFIPTFMRG